MKLRKIKAFLQSKPAFWAAAAPFIFFIVPLLQGKTLFWGLPSLQFIPWRHYAWTLLREGILPLWNPLNGMGAPLLANYQLALFYPPAIPLFLLDQFWGVSGLAWGFTLLIPVHLAWGAVGMSRFMRQLGAGNRGQLVAGLAFGMSGYLVARGSFFSIIWAAAWMPWVMCWVEKVISAGSRRETLKDGLILSLMIAMMLLAGHAQISWYALLLASLWLLFRILHSKRSRLVRQKIAALAVFALLAVLLAAVQLVPTFEYLQQSQRAAAYDPESALVYSFSPLRLVGYFTPELFGNPGHGDFWGYATYWEDAVYIGLAPILLALTTIAWLRSKKHRENPWRSTVIFFWSVSLVGVILALGSNTPIFPWLFQHVPTFDMFQAPARWMLWPTFSLAVLSGFGADRWQAPAKKGRVALNLAAFGGIILALSAGAASLVLIEWEPGIFRGLIYFGLVLSATVFIARRIQPAGTGSVWSILAGGVIVLDLFSASMFLNPTVPADIWAEENHHLNEVNLARDGGRVWMDAATEQKIKYSWYFQFDNFQNRKNWEDLRSSQLANLNLLDEIPMVNNFDPLLPARFASWKDMMAETTPLVQELWLKEVGAGAQIITDPSGIKQLMAIPIISQPRFSWSPCAVPAASPEEALNLMDRPIRSRVESECVVVESRDPLAGPAAGEGNADLKVLKDSPNHIELSIETTRDGWILVRDSWFPGWHAYLDGRETDLYPANYLFKALPVPAGNHQLALEYKPASFTIGLITSIIAWILWSAAWVFFKRR